MEQRFDLKFREIPVQGYERVVEVSDALSGLKAIIALHNTKLGPALGGIRAYPYASYEEALNDVLRLSQGMTYKSALCETGTGGGKSVIILSKDNKKTREMLLAFGEAINHFAGLYIGAEDVGMAVGDLAVVGSQTHYSVGLPHPRSSGDPSWFTARGGYYGIRAVCRFLWESESLAGKRIAIQGLGSVGMKLAHFLFWEGARLIVADIDPSCSERARRELGAEVVAPEEIHKVECDIFAPCALGGIISPKTIADLKCQAVAGLANNQLLTEEDGMALFKKGILYAPDYAINSGGLMNVCVELEPEGYNPAVARHKLSYIFDILLTIFTLSKEKHLPTSQVANELAEYNLEKLIGKRETKPYFHH